MKLLFHILLILSALFLIACSDNKSSSTQNTNSQTPGNTPINLTSTSSEQDLTIQLTSTSPSSPKAPEININLVRQYYNNGLYKEAIKKIAEFKASSLPENLKDELDYLLALSHLKLGIKTKSIDYILNAKKIIKSLLSKLVDKDEYSTRFTELLLALAEVGNYFKVSYQELEPHLKKLLLKYSNSPTEKSLATQIGYIYFYKYSYLNGTSSDIKNAISYFTKGLPDPLAYVGLIKAYLLKKQKTKASAIADIFFNTYKDSQYCCEVLCLLLSHRVKFSYTPTEACATNLACRCLKVSSQPVTRKITKLKRNTIKKIRKPKKVPHYRFPILKWQVRIGTFSDYQRARRTLEAVRALGIDAEIVGLANGLWAVVSIPTADKLEAESLLSRIKVNFPDAFIEKVTQ